MSRYSNIFRKCSVLKSAGFLSTSHKNFTSISCNSVLSTDFNEKNYKSYHPLINKRFNQVNPVKCWKCGIERSNIKELFCEQCNSVQSPPQRKNYFKLFDIKEAFTIDQKSLTQKYRQLQTILHPDKFSNRADAERSISEDFSALLSHAYNVLQTPLDRAIHLLAIYGETVDEDQKVSDPGFLMEIMELNEEVENVNNPEDIKALEKKNKAMLSKISEEIDLCFRNRDIQEAKSHIIKMKYYDRIGKRISSIIRERGLID